MSDEKNNIDEQVIDLIKKKNAESIIELIKAHRVSDDNSMNELLGNNYSRILQFAISQGNIDLLEVLAATKDFDVNRYMVMPQSAFEGLRFNSVYKLPPVFYAIMQAKPEIVKWFINKGADIHASVEGIRFMDADGIRFKPHGTINALSALGVGVGREGPALDKLEPLSDLRLVKIKEIVQIFVDSKLNVNKQFDEANNGILNRIFDRTRPNNLLEEILKNLVDAGLDLEKVLNRDYKRRLRGSSINGFPMLVFAVREANWTPLLGVKTAPQAEDPLNNDAHMQEVIVEPDSKYAVPDLIHQKSSIVSPDIAVKFAKEFFKAAADVLLVEDLEREKAIISSDNSASITDVEVEKFKQEIISFCNRRNSAVFGIQPKDDIENNGWYNEVLKIQSYMKMNLYSNHDDETKKLFLLLLKAQERGGSAINRFIDAFCDWFNEKILRLFDPSLKTQFVEKLSSVVANPKSAEKQPEL